MKIAEEKNKDFYKKKEIKIYYECNRKSWRVCEPNVQNNY